MLVCASACESVQGRAKLDTVVRVYIWACETVQVGVSLYCACDAIHVVVSLNKCV